MEVSLYYRWLAYILFMGNEPQGTRRLSKPTRYSRNSYSLDASIMSHRLENIPSERERDKPPSNDLVTPSPPTRYQEATPPPPSPARQETMQRSLTNPQTLSSKQTKVSNDQRLSDLNIKNDKLRKELIKISS